MLPLRRLVAVAALLLAATPVSAQVYKFDDCMSADQAGSASPGFGIMFTTLSSFADEFSINGSYFGLTGTVTDVHLREGGIGQSGAIITSMSHSGMTMGGFNRTLTLTQPQFDMVLAGETYVELVTTSGVELRGQIIQQENGKAPSELSLDPDINDAGGNAFIGPRVSGCAPEPFNLEIDCSRAVQPGIWLIEVRTGFRSGGPLTTKWGYAYLDGPKIGSAAGVHAMDAQYFFPTPMSLPPDLSLVGMTYYAQGYCGGYSPGGRTSDLLVQTIGF